MKTGIMGGTFNPIHSGHLQIADELFTRFELDRVLFIPAASPPHKDDTGLLPFHHRYEMVKRAVAQRPAYQPCDIEAQRSGKSYSVDTLRQLHRQYPDDEFYFLIGMDSLLTLTSWHRYPELFSLCHLVVARRPGSQPPTSDVLPVAIRPQFCYDSVLKTFCHTSGHRLYFLEETFVNISSTTIRQNIKQHRPVATLLPAAVNDYIKAHQLYAPVERSTTLQSDQRALLCAEYALDKKASDVKVLHISELSSLTDYLLLATGTSDRQVQAIAESVRIGLKQNYDLQPLAVEGMNEGRWVLLDYGDVMVHVFQQDVRSFYDLDGLWAEAKELELPAELTAGH